MIDVADLPPRPSPISVRQGVAMLCPGPWLGLLITMGSATAWYYPVRYTKLYRVGHMVMTPTTTERSRRVLPSVAAKAHSDLGTDTTAHAQARCFSPPTSGPREAILLRRLQEVNTSVVALKVAETFLIRAQDERLAQEVAAFLESCATQQGSARGNNFGAVTAQGEAGLHEHVSTYGPKLSVPSVWSSNVRAILTARGLAADLRALPVLERGRAYSVYTTQAQPLGPAVERLLYDVMTECRYPPPPLTAEARHRVVSAWTQGGLLATSQAEAGVSERVLDTGGVVVGREGIQQAAEGLGVRMTDWDADFVAQYFNQHVGRPPTEVELFDVAQSLSEHCRHWTFFGKFVVDGEEKDKSLLDLVKEPLERRRAQGKGGDKSVLAFCDNSSAIRGWRGICILQPSDPTGPSPFLRTECHVHPTLTAETHNFPCTVAPFPGAQTGVGGRIRDIQAVGRGGVTLGGLAGYAVGDLRAGASARKGWVRPPHVSSALSILIGASDGASDYANKFGEPLIAGFARSHPSGVGESAGGYEFVKPIMFSAGVGTVREEHVAKHDTPLHHEHVTDLRVVKVGGPPLRVGLGGGGASSRVGGGAQEDEHETNAVQRGDPEVGNKVGRLLRACVELGEGNVLCSVHDQGAGGNANVLKELVAPAGGAHIDMQRVARGGLESLTPLELWAAEYQESYGLLVHHKDVPLLQRLGEREAVGVDVVGSITGSGRITVSAHLTTHQDKQQQSQEERVYVDLPLDPLLGHRTQRVFHVTSAPTQVKGRGEGLGALPVLSEVSLWGALERVLAQVAVGSKGFLVHKVDRSVSGLVAAQPCVGPLALPVGDVGVCALSYWGREGVATALGECPNLANHGVQAMARMALGEALTNLVWAPFTSWDDIKLQANWMWPPPVDMPHEGAKLYHAVAALGEAVSGLGLALDGGKDSLSMAVSCPTTDKQGTVTVPSPPTVVITAYVTTPDVAGVVSPYVKEPLEGREGVLLYVDLGNADTQGKQGKKRLGGSALAQALGWDEEQGPDVTHTHRLRQGLEAVQGLVRRGLVLAGHDVSAGGLLTTVLEMAMAGDAGARLDLTHVDSDGWRALFSEELGVVMEVAGTQEQDVREWLHTHAPGLRAIRIGTSTVDRRVSVTHEGHVLLDKVDTATLRALWEETSLRLEEEQTNPACVQAERSFIQRQRRPRWHVPFDLKPTPPKDSVAPKVAILREQGSNGDREMAAAFTQAGFQAWDITVGDLVSGRASLQGFQGLALVGGFSYGDALGSARGWASVLRGNGRARDELQRFFGRSDTFSLGVCNGCQLLVELGVVGGGEARLVENESGRFESRFVSVQVGESKALMLRGMQGAVLGVWAAHGEGRFTFHDTTRDDPQQRGRRSMVYVDASSVGPGPEEAGSGGYGYPCNPCGSTHHVAALCSDDGRHLAVMPHPERSWIRWQVPWQPREVTAACGEYTPWLRMFQNAYTFCVEEREQVRQEPTARAARVAK